MLNWWIDSDPESVYALGSLDHYGNNGELRAANCRTCPHTEKCKFYYDITRNKNYMDLYVANENMMVICVMDVCSGMILTFLIRWRLRSNIKMGARLLIL